MTVAERSRRMDRQIVSGAILARERRSGVPTPAGIDFAVLGGFERFGYWDAAALSPHYLLRTKVIYGSPGREVNFQI